MSVRGVNKIELSTSDVASLMESALMPVDPSRLQLANFPPADVYLRYLARLIQLTIDARARIVSTDFELIFRSLTFHGDDEALDQIERHILFSHASREEFRLSFHFSNEEVLSVVHPNSIDADTIEKLRAQAGQDEQEPWAFAMLSSFPAALGDFFRQAFEVTELFVYADASARYNSLVYDLGGTSAVAAPPSPFVQRGLRRLLRRRNSPNPYRLAPLSPDELAAAHLEAYVTQRATEQDVVLRQVTVYENNDIDLYDYVILNRASGRALGYRLSILYAELINHTSSPPVWDDEWRAFIPTNVEEPLGVRSEEEINSWLSQAGV